MNAGQIFAFQSLAIGRHAAGGTSAAPALDRLPPMLGAIAAAAVRHDRDGSFPFDSLERLHLAGILSLTVPAALGGGGAGLGLATEAVTQVAEACPATALVLAMQLARQVAIARSAAWPRELRQRIGRDAVTQGALVNLLRAEPEPARDGQPATVARLRAGHWSISGRKRHVTGAPGLRWMEVLARTDEAVPRIGIFLVPADARGIDLHGTWMHPGLRASGSHDIAFRDVAVPLDHGIALQPAEQPARPDAMQSAWETMLLAAVHTGIARAARRWVEHVLHDGMPGRLGAPLATLPRLPQAASEIATLLAANARITGAVAFATDSGHPPGMAQSALHGITLAGNAVRAVERSLALAGRHAHDRALPLERHWRDVQSLREDGPHVDAMHPGAGTFGRSMPMLPWW